MPVPAQEEAEEKQELEYSEVDQLQDDLLLFLGAASRTANSSEDLFPSEFSSRLRRYASNFLRTASLQVRRSMLSRMLDRSIRQGHGWTLCLHDLLRNLSRDSEMEPRFDQMAPSLDEWSPGKVQTTQSLLPFVSLDKASSLVFSEVGRLLSSSEATADPTERDTSHLSVITSGIRSLRSAGSESKAIDIDASLISVLKWIEEKREHHEERFLYET